MSQNHRVLLAELVEVAAAVAATRSRNAKVELIAGLLRRLRPSEVPAAVGFLAGEPRQGKIGIGWAGLTAVPWNAASSPSLTITDLDRLLTKIEETTGSGSRDERTHTLSDFLSLGTPEEGDFVRRLLVGELRQGALGGVMTDSVAAAAQVPSSAVRRAFMLCGDLGLTARVALDRGPEGLAEIGLEPLRPVRPMLASTSESLAEALGRDRPASVEWKLDGVRIQAHRRADVVGIFTRNLNEVTEQVPGVASVVANLDLESVVLDGEAIGLDLQDRPHLFQETMSRIGRSGFDPEFRTAAFFFDCLHLDGVDLIDRPLSERLESMERVGGLLRVPAIVTTEVGEAERFLDEALAAGHEGVIVKSLDSSYQAGRRGGSWRKVKPARTLDLVVLAAEWGHGRRQGWLSNLHLGARAPSGGFVMVGKTFKGLTDELLRWQTDRLLQMEVDREGIVVRVRPELVVEIELDGAQVSPRYPGGVALRFARVLRYRPDKRAEDADTIATVRTFLDRGGEATPA